MKKFILTLLATVATVSVAYVAPKQESDGGTKDEEKKGTVDAGDCHQRRDVSGCC